MELRPSDTEQQLIDAFAALYAKESPPERVRDAEPLGFDERLWAQLTEMGVVAMAVDETHGGWGATLLDLALVAEQHGRALGSAPLVEAQVAARLLARVGDGGAAALEAMLAGERLVTVSFTPCRDGRALMVPAGAVADAVVVRVDDAVLLADVDDTRPDGRIVPENLGSMPVADLDVSSAQEIASGVDAVAGFEAALDDWLALTANALVGIAARSVEIGVDYVVEREAFGQKIGAFQAVAHPLADAATAADGAQLLAREAAWAADEQPERFAELAAMAFAFSAETAADASYRALHVHGGYGFMMEYDIQLHYRRARAWPAVVMSPAAAYRRAADARYRPREAR